MAMPAWVSEAQVFGTFVLGSSVAWLGYQQYKISRRKLKLDLYEKRWAIYNAMRTYITATYLDKDELKRATLLAYEKKAEARFLLDNEACEYIDKLVKEISDFNNTKELIASGEAGGYSRGTTNLGELQMERTGWIMEQYEPLVAVFHRFLNIDHNV